jgi:hypothetical protein
MNSLILSPSIGPSYLFNETIMTVIYEYDLSLSVLLALIKLTFTRSNNEASHSET